MHQVKVDVVGLERLEGGLNTLLNALVPGVIELGGDPDLLTGDTGVLNTKTDLVLVAVGKSSVNVTVASEESGLDGFADLVGLGLPCSKTDSGDFGTLNLVSLLNCAASASQRTVLRVKVCLVWSSDIVTVIADVNCRMKRRSGLKERKLNQRRASVERNVYHLHLSCLSTSACLLDPLLRLHLPLAVAATSPTPPTHLLLRASAGG